MREQTGEARPYILMGIRSLARGSIRGIARGFLSFHIGGSGVAVE
jgi:hypothetical protein